MGGLNKAATFPLLSRKLWTVFQFLFAEVNHGHISSRSPLSKIPGEKASSGSRQQGNRDRGSPSLPALPTPRGSDIRGSPGTGHAASRALRRACAGAGPPGGSWQH